MFFVLIKSEVKNFALFFVLQSIWLLNVQYWDLNGGSSREVTKRCWRNRRLVEFEIQSLKTCFQRLCGANYAKLRGNRQQREDKSSEAPQAVESL